MDNDLLSSISIYLEDNILSMYEEFKLSSSFNDPQSLLPLKRTEYSILLDCLYSTKEFRSKKLISSSLVCIIFISIIY